MTDEAMADLVARVTALEATVGDTTTDPPGMSVAYRLNRLEQQNGWVPPAAPPETQAALEQALQDSVAGSEPPVATK